MAEGLEIRIAADVEAALKALRNVRKELKDTENAGSKTGGGLDNLNDKFKKLPNTIGQTSTTLTNFSRVIQDAPYGIIGVANNIDPLVTSFNQLKASTGSTKAALSELIASLAGPAGIAIAVSTITSLLVKFGDQIFSSSKKISSAELDNINYSASLDRISESLSNLKRDLDFANEIGKVNNQLKGLAGPALNIANAQQEIGNNNKYISDLDDKIAPLKTKFNDATKEAQKYLNETQKFKDIPSEQFAAGARQYILGKREELDNFYSYYLKTKEISSDLLKTLSKADQDRFTNLQNNNKKLSQLEDERRTYQDKNALLEAQIELDRVNRLEEIKDKTIKQATQISEHFKDRISIKFNISPFDTKEETYLNAKDFIDKVQNGVYKSFEEGWNKSVRDIRDAELTPIEVRNIKIVLTGGEISTTQSEVEKSIKKMNQDMASKRDLFKDKEQQIPSSLSPKAAKQYKKYLEDIQKAADDSTEAVDAINKKIGELANSMVVTLGESIGTALAGGDVSKVFESFGMTVAAGLEFIGKKLIELGGLAELVDKALKSLFTGVGGPLAIVAGIGLIAAAAAMRTTLSKGVSARATGGPVSGNQPYLVGERGPELFMPAVSGSIVPNNQVGSFMGGRMMGGNGGGGSILRGQDIILAYARTQRSQLRING